VELEGVAYCKDFGVVGVGLREVWLDMRVEVSTCIGVKLLLGGCKPGFAEEGNEALPIFAGNVRILEGSKKIAVDFGIVEATVGMLLSEYQ